MEIQIPFNTWSAENISFWGKRATSRRKQYGEVGDTFFVLDKEYKIDLIARLPLWFIDKELYESEGCLTPAAFKRIWRAIHGLEEWNGEEIVYYHHFRKVGEKQEED
jgi:hypothetical protein